LLVVAINIVVEHCNGYCQSLQMLLLLLSIAMVLSIVESVVGEHCNGVVNC